MKRKPLIDFHSKNSTDFLITSSCAVVSSLNQIEEELDALKDKETFDINKAENFAVTFIDKAERLLEKEGQGERELIEELRKSVKYHDTWRVMMQTLKLAIITFSAGEIPYHVHAGARHQPVHGGGIRGGKKSSIVRIEKAKSIKEIEQAEAEMIWKKHPTWGKPAIAKKVAEKIGGNPDTIRKHINKSLP